MPVTRRLIAQALRVVGVEPDTVSDVEIALSEACANVLRHAQVGDSYEVRAGFDQERAFLEIIDQGAGFADTSGPAGRRRRGERARGRAHARADGQGAFRDPAPATAHPSSWKSACASCRTRRCGRCAPSGASDRRRRLATAIAPSSRTRRLSRRRNRRGRRRRQSGPRSTTVEAWPHRPPRIGVVTFPGSLDDRDALRAVTLAGAQAVPLWHADSDLHGVDAVVLPGGFSYGDYLRAGAIARFSPVVAELVEAAHDGLPVLGICNGFQVLCEAGLLPGALTRNAGLRFVCRDQQLTVENTGTFWTAGYEPGATIVIPVKHGDGRFVAEPSTIAELEARRSGRLPLRRRQSERFDRRHRRRLLHRRPGRRADAPPRARHRGAHRPQPRRARHVHRRRSRSWSPRDRRWPPTRPRACTASSASPTTSTPASSRLWAASPAGPSSPCTR